MDLLKRTALVGLALCGSIAFTACQSYGNRDIEPAGRAPAGAEGRAKEPGATGSTTEPGTSESSGTPDQSSGSSGSTGGSSSESNGSSGSSGSGY